MPTKENQIIGLEINKFIEKPYKDIAVKSINYSRFTWDSDMFIFKASTIITELKKFALEILNYCKMVLEANIEDLDFLRLGKESLKKCPKIFIDFAVMEKTNLGIVLPLNVG